MHFVYRNVVFPDSQVECFGEAGGYLDNGSGVAARLSCLAGRGVASPDAAVTYFCLRALPAWYFNPLKLYSVGRGLKLMWLPYAALEGNVDSKRGD